MTNFTEWFHDTLGMTPHPWQKSLGTDANFKSRLIRIPTGLGKTIGVGAAWAFHAVVQQDLAWPRRLVWCLPSRVLVEQTAEVLQDLIHRTGAPNPEMPRPGVHVLMGGESVDPWHQSPADTAILVGTQDMLLSRTLGRGYASSRARWPIEYGLLNQDCLWVIDEVQLHGVGLPTSVQLQVFRDETAHADTAPMIRPAATWWMSATLQPHWLDTVDSLESLSQLSQETLTVQPQDRAGPAWESSKSIKSETISGKPDDAKVAAQWAERIIEVHSNSPSPGTRVTLVVVNRVKFAVGIYDALNKAFSRADPRPEIQLVHSRFRMRERKQWAESFLSKAASLDDQANRIIVATQVVEAGVDISASALVTELAPWPSLVQRFGRAARYGGEAEITVIDRQPSAKDTGPYDECDLMAAAEAIQQTDGVSLADLHTLEERMAADDATLLERLYRFEYIHLLARRDCDELFDTTPDLSGADLDVGRFIRESDDRDVKVCWYTPNSDWEIEQFRPPSDLRAVPDAICSVPIADAKKWLLDKSRAPKRKSKEPYHAWHWDYIEERWTRVEHERDILPGRIILVDTSYGGYVAHRGFTGKKPTKSEPPIDTVGAVTRQRDRAAAAALADSAQSRDDLSESDQPKTIATHGREAAQAVLDLADRLNIHDAIADTLERAARWHDWGKAHHVFQGNIRRDNGNHRQDLAKSPSWIDFQSAEFNNPPPAKPDGPRFGKRRGFRHELATALGILELLSRAAPQHAALLGPFDSLVELNELTPVPRAAAPEQSPLITELQELDADEFNLLLYLTCGHHGKVRCGLQATPHDQEFDVSRSGLIGSGMPINGVRDGDPLPGIEICTRDGGRVDIPDVAIHLDVAEMGLGGRYGCSWSERIAALRRKWGVFNLAYMEALLRAADVEASRLTTEDPVLKSEVV